MSSYNFKIVLLGQGCVGKTSLVLRYVSNVFNDSHQSTLQASFLKKQLYLDQDLVRLNIWDTAGQEKFHALGPIYYREAHGALLVYDVTNPDSLSKVRNWIKELNKMLGIENVRLAIVGNKMDLLQPTASQVQQQQQQHATSNGVQHQRELAGGGAPEVQRAAANALVHEAKQLAGELLNAQHYLTSAKHNQGIGELFLSLARRMVEHERKLAQARDSRAQLGSRLMRRTISLADEHDDEAEPVRGQVSGKSPSRHSSSRSNNACQC